MEPLPINKLIESPAHVGTILPDVVEHIELISSPKSFIESNTLQGSLESLRNEHIIPVFIKDNEPVISHSEFIDVTMSSINEVFKHELILQPNIRLSHPIKGRVPEARNKPANELKDNEKTLYYERMAFVVEIPSINTNIQGNRLNLTIGGVKAYNLDNLYSKSGADQHFRVFIGFKNTICTNLCVSTDGYLANLRVKSLEHLKKSIHSLICDYNPILFSEQLSSFKNFDLTEKQFVNLIGRCKLFKYMPDIQKEGIIELAFGDSQLNSISRDYFADVSFCSNPDGSINLWKLYNLFTGSSKSSYIDSFLERNVNAFTLINDLMAGLISPGSCWYLN